MVYREMDLNHSSFTLVNHTRMMLNIISCGYSFMAPFYLFLQVKIKYKCASPKASQVIPVHARN